MNLNAAYICENFPEEIKYLVKAADFVFANSWELSALNAICGFNTSEETIDYFFSKYTKLNKQKIVIITNSSNNIKTYVGSRDGYVFEEFPVLPIPPEMVIDTTGAGDAFVAGFLYMFLRQERFADCIKHGSDIAAQVISQIGCVLAP